jgi:hypothetical protein
MHFIVKISRGRIALEIKNDTKKVRPAPDT